MFDLKWQKCLNYFKKKLSKYEFSMWIRSLKPKFKKNKLIIYTPNKFILDWVKENYFKKIHYLINNFNNYQKIPIKLIINKKLKITKKYTNFYINQHNFQKKNVLEIHKKKFKNFILCKKNKIAYKSAYKIAKYPGKKYNPLFIYGKTGLGKTHLLYSIKNFILKKNKNLKVIYINSENFVQKMVQSLKNNSIEKFKKYYRSANILLIDDIQFFSNKKRSQEELFHTFNNLIEQNKQIVLTSDRYPTKIQGIQNKLKSRLDWGLSISIKPPKKNTRIKILIKKSFEKNIYLSYEVAKYIAKKLKSNIRELEGAINKIHANLIHNSNKNINIEFINKIFKDLFNTKKKKINIKKVQEIVANYYNVKLSDMLSKKRSKSIILARQISISLIKKLTKHSLKEIGESFNKKTHTTVLYSCKKIHKLLYNNLEIKKDYFYLLKKLS
ncbi:chromosomal replication initiator protein DnaA [Buchnera aphidicola]|uniref:chromosomal replication initiator protein DnaA n=1 Tax=Buchnera aphidicola TaxID=9 RepID=UPI002238568B|nr:chromosomal replication initiator protein DnaA [Buchnera aphidicola]MCW5197411.1 chromosomal replication initiator protein DnaA [Buchnera aphidicola (Chaitophorus viminalis)]